jgi:hypothetical protein
MLLVGFTVLIYDHLLTVRAAASIEIWFHATHKFVGL